MKKKKKPTKKGTQKRSPAHTKKKKLQKKKALSRKKEKGTSKKGKKETLRERALLLINKGRERGFITYNEILKTYPSIEDDVLFLDERYETLGEAGIDVLEGGELLSSDEELL